MRLPPTVGTAWATQLVKPKESQDPRVDTVQTLARGGSAASRLNCTIGTTPGIDSLVSQQPFEQKAMQLPAAQSRRQMAV